MIGSSACPRRRHRPIPAPDHRRTAKPRRSRRKWSRSKIRPAASGQPDGDTAHEDPLDIRDYFGDAQMATHFNSNQDPDDFSLVEFGQNLVLSRNRDLLDEVMRKAMRLLKARRMKSAGRAS